MIAWGVSAADEPDDTEGSGSEGRSDPVDDPEEEPEAPDEEPEAPAEPGDVPADPEVPAELPAAEPVPEPAPVTRTWTEDEIARARIAAEDLLAGARVHGIDAAWVQAHVDIAEGGRSAEDRWTRALRPFGPLETALAGGDGVLEVIPGPDYLRAVVDTEPVLSVLVHPALNDVMRLVSIEATTCTRCDERRRFVEDLVAQVRRTGVLGDRLLPDLELDLATGSAKDGWASLQESRMRADESIADAVAGAEILRTEGEVVRLRYPSGDEDTWHVVRTARGWGVAYEDLAPSSPLRMSTWESRKWRKLSLRQQTAVDTWTPSWRTTGLGAGTVVGHHTIAGAIDPHDDTVLLLGLDDQVPGSGLYRVDPVARTVVGRWRIPLPDIDDVPTITTRASSWRWAFDRSVHKAALLAFGRIWTIDTSGDAVKEVARGRTITAPAWDEVGRLYWIQAADSLSGTADAPPRPSTEDAVAAWVDGAWTSVVTEPGQVVTWRAGIEEPLRVEACPYGATAAVAHPVSGSWLVACRSGDARSFVVVHQPGSGVEPVDGDGAAGDALAWSADGRYVALGMPADAEASMVVWDVAQRRPDVVVGSRAAVSASFSADGDHLLVVDDTGEAVLWDLAIARRRGAVRTWPPALEAEAP